MSPSPVKEIQEIPIEGPFAFFPHRWCTDILLVGRNSQNPPRVSASCGTVHKDGGSTAVENARKLGNPSPWLTPSQGTYDIADIVSPLQTSGDRSSDNMTKVLSYEPTGKPFSVLVPVWMAIF